MSRPRKGRPNWNDLATIWRRSGDDLATIWRRSGDDLATIWQVSDEMWSVIGPILRELDPPKATGRPRVEVRATLDAILFRLRSGCQWNQLPERFPDDSSVHRTFQRWVRLGVVERIWSTLVEACAELGGGDWEWQAADGALGKARLGGPQRPQSHRPGQTGRETQSAG